MIGGYGIILVVCLFVFSAFACMGMLGQWYNVQDQAQFVAMSEGRYGGYTTDATASMSEWCQNSHLDPSRVGVTVSAPGAPVVWGTPVTAKVSEDFNFKVGNWFSFVVPITGVGRSVSAYIQNTISVCYACPAYKAAV